MLKEFKDFINRGNVVDLAVAVVIGAAFATIIASFTTDILGGVLAAIGGAPNLDSAYILELGDGEVKFGAFLSAVINFLIVAFAVFLVVKGLNAMQNLRTKEEEQATAETELDLLREIRDELRARP